MLVPWSARIAEVGGLRAMVCRMLVGTVMGDAFHWQKTP